MKDLLSMWKQVMEQPLLVLVNKVFMTTGMKNAALSNFLEI